MGVEIQMSELRSLLQNAGYYEWIREDLSGIRKLGKCIKPWVNSPRQIIPGVYLRSRHTMSGKSVWFTDDPNKKPQFKLSSGLIEKLEKFER
jgi:hypothetical protein